MAKKYYWIKLKKDFFSLDEIDYLLSQNRGFEYVVLYQMLCLLTMNSNGKLIKEINEIIVPFDVERISRETKYFGADTISLALDCYKELGLIYEDDNKILTISKYDEMVGSEVSKEHINKLNAERQKRYRNKKKSNVTVTLQSNGEYRDKSIESEKEESNTLTHNPIQSKTTQNNHEEEKENTSHPPTQLSLNEYTRKFYELYDMYPNHEFKDQALKFWLSSKYDIETIEYIENGIRRYSNREGKLKTLYYFLADETWKDYIEIEKEIPGMDVIEEEMFRDLYK
ncbi:MAG: hypothetical protein HFF36_09705 [Coprobacillus sp.]|nr:hypothetical protein [Coprobacillus sp.]